MSEPIRRAFLTGTAALGVSVASGQSRPGSAATASTSEFRIRELDLLTSCSLPEMEMFYRDVLEFRILESRTDLLSIGAGGTIVNFRPTTRGRPFYHFAFNIPQNKIVQARNWMAERTPLAPTPAHMLDSNYPKEVRYFRN